MMKKNPYLQLFVSIRILLLYKTEEDMNHEETPFVHASNAHALLVRLNTDSRIFTVAEPPKYFKVACLLYVFSKSASI